MAPLRLLPYVLLLLLLLQYTPTPIDAHGFTTSPRSRNFVAYEDGKWWGGTATDPQPEDCPHCLNLGGTLSTCGLSGTRDYSYPKSAINTPLAPKVQATYVQGQVIDIETVLTAHHKGHFTFKACPINPGEDATQACFDSHPLEFLQDNLYGAPQDPNYPERAYIPLLTFPGLQQETTAFGPATKYSHRLKLPQSLVGDLVLIQWYYLTANSCIHPGYDTYPWPTGFYDESQGLGFCVNIPPDGRGVPEQFWNCAEVKIVSGGTPISTTIPPETTDTPQTTDAPVTTAPPGTTTSTTSESPETPVVSTALRCGTSEIDARENCRPTCTLVTDCPSEQLCLGVYANYCGSIDKPTWVDPPTVSNVPLRCGSSEIDAREFCGSPCFLSTDCDTAAGEFCYTVLPNYCGSESTARKLLNLRVGNNA